MKSVLATSNTSPRLGDKIHIVWGVPGGMSRDLQPDEPCTVPEGVYDCIAIMRDWILISNESSIVYCIRKEIIEARPARVFARRDNPYTVFSEDWPLLLQ